MSNSQLVLVGGVDWLNPAWRGGFYPDDLPEDWMLSYYNTQFQAVYLPATAWRTVPNATWTQWLNETQESFFFVLEPTGDGTIKPPSDRVLMANPGWIDAHVWWLDEAPDMRALAQRITHHAAIGELLFVFSRSCDLGLMQQVNALKLIMGY